METTFTLLNQSDAPIVISILENNGYSSFLRADGALVVTHDNYDAVKALINEYIPHLSAEELALIQLIKDTENNAITKYSQLPEWAKTGTAEDAETYITSQILNGQTEAEISAWIDANVTSLAQAKVAMKQIAGALVTMRGLFILIAKLLLFIRDLVIRFRKIQIEEARVNSGSNPNK